MSSGVRSQSMAQQVQTRPAVVTKEFERATIVLHWNSHTHRCADLSYQSDGFCLCLSIVLLQQSLSKEWPACTPPLLLPQKRSNSILVSPMRNSAYSPDGWRLTESLPHLEAAWLVAAGMSALAAV